MISNKIKALFSLLYPNVCIGCDKEDPVYENPFCHFCWEEIPRFEDIGLNKEILKSRFPLISDANFFGMYLYTKGSILQNVMRKIKYQNRNDIAQKLGGILANKIPENSYDGLIPIPIHIKKLRRRGYNQAQEIANGLSQATGIPIFENALKKVLDTESQTKQDRISRRLNVMKAYSSDVRLLHNVKKVLLIDDVITTGATLEVCSEKLQEFSEIQVDYAFIALTV